MLPDSSRSKDNQTIKFRKLVEYNRRNIFVEKSYTKCVGEVPDPSLKIKIDQISESTV